MPSYARDRPWPGASNWSDAHSRDALQAMADNCRRLAGFQDVVINVVHRGVYRAVAVTGDRRDRELLMDSELNPTVLAEEVSRSERWGRCYHFVPAGSAEPNEAWFVTPDYDKADAEDAWDAEDLLFAPLRDSDGVDIGFLCLDRPDTGRRPSVEDLVALDRYADQVRAAVVVATQRHSALARLDELAAVDETSLIATVAHELRGPLSAVIGHLEMLRDSPRLAAEERRSVVAAQRAAGRMHRTADDLLVLARVRDSHGRDDAARADVRTVAAGVVEVLGPAAAAAGIELALKISAGALVARAEPRHLERAVLNLVGNAIKFSPRGSSVTLELDRADDEVVVTIRDRGIGISAADLAELGTQFFRSTNPAALAVAGSGLGLSIAHQVAERVGGRLEVESELGQGSCFRLVLPALP